MEDDIWLSHPVFMLLMKTLNNPSHCTYAVTKENEIFRATPLIYIQSSSFQLLNSLCKIDF